MIFLFFVNISVIKIKSQKKTNQIKFQKFKRYFKIFKSLIDVYDIININLNLNIFSKFIFKIKFLGL